MASISELSSSNEQLSRNLASLSKKFKLATFQSKSASYTLTLADQIKTILQTSGSGTNLTVPPNSTAPFAIGTQITVIQMGAGQVTFVPGAGVTISSAGGALKLRVQFSSGLLVKTGTNTWVLVGDLGT